MIDILIKKGYLEKCYQFEKTKGFERVIKIHQQYVEDNIIRQSDSESYQG